ncbi:phosphatase PAP2 family protein [Acuticoccus sp. M5D2P5]|uniref:phosphatase PAP2 family protein n=1 Tax=Acuticoccus kalidii TaxID=2910977 RepID=UPI001F3197E2|nr:phosphatase PAP2 family protein [Acuticoccus kalidii]MCF3932738.1 phosphatase PAP2 family protein [Acuticoccus kalidii]
MALLLVIAACGWIFMGVADEVMEGETHALDTAILLALRDANDPSNPLGPRWLEEMVRDFTALGGFGILTFITFAVSGLMLLHGKVRTTLFLLASIGGGVVFSSLAKHLFDRPRPDLVPHDSFVTSASFPSGHSMMAAITYLTLAALLARIEPRRSIKIYLIGLACLISGFVGVSRVYLGVHWPTDVLAGWTAGAAWALSCWLIANWLERAGEIEPEVREVTPTTDHPD